MRLVRVFADPPVLPPISTEGLTEADIEPLMERVRSAMLAKLQEFHARRKGTTARITAPTHL